MCKQTRIVFVTSQQAIGQKLCNSIQNFVEMFEDISFLKGCTSLCVTKVDPHLKTHHVENKLRQFKEGFSELTQRAKEFLEMTEADICIIKQPTEQDVSFEQDLVFKSGYFASNNNTNYKVVINKDSIKQAKQMQNSVDKHLTRYLKQMWKFLVDFNTDSKVKPSSFDLIIDLKHIQNCMRKMKDNIGEPLA